MKITFVTPTPPDVSAFGVRSLSAYLKKEGKQVRNIFLPGGIKKYKYRKEYIYEYEKSIIEQTIELCKGSDLIGISFMTNYYDRALQLTNEIRKKIDIPIVWGGIHPTVAPENSLKHVDMICIGEGEEALLELIQKIEDVADYYETLNFWFKKDDKVIKNPLRPLTKNIDVFPFFDFGLEDHFIFDNDKNAISPMTKNLLKKCFPYEPNLEGSFNDSYKRTISYKTMTTRGCPHHCTFCVERGLANLYQNQRYLRRRTVQHVILELMHIKTHLPFIESIFLFDDTFTGRPLEEIIEFSKEFKSKIGLPFHIQASPTTLTKDKLDALIEGGLVFVEMGIQSVSKTGMNIYNRNITKNDLLKKAQLLKFNLDKIHPPCYHVILDNPWETNGDVLETLMFLLELPTPFWLKRSSLVCFPGTDLYKKAKRESLIKGAEDEKREIYNKHLHVPQSTYVNFLVYLAGFSKFPRWIIKALAKNPIFFICDRKIFIKLYYLLIRGIEITIILYKGIRSLLTGDIVRIYKFIKRTYS